MTNTTKNAADLLVEAQSEIDAIDRRIELVRADFVRRGGGDKTHLRDQIKRMESERTAIGERALARCNGGAA